MGHSPTRFSNLFIYILSAAEFGAWSPGGGLALETKMEIKTFSSRLTPLNGGNLGGGALRGDHARWPETGARILAMAALASLSLIFFSCKMRPPPTPMASGK